MAEKTGNYVALLRGVNVGGKNRLPMVELAAMFKAAGCLDVRTYIQSGNVVFKASMKVAERIPELIATGISKQFGFGSPVVLRSAEELAAVIGNNPYVAAGADAEALHVMFLADTPAQGNIATLDEKRSLPDEFTVRNKEVYLRCPNGLGRTKLTNDYFDRRLSTVSTVRNWRTVLKLLEMVEMASPG